MAPKRVQTAASLNKNSFCRIHKLPPFCINTNLRENRFFAARWAVVDKKATFSVKFLAEKFTTVNELTSERVNHSPYRVLA